MPTPHDYLEQARQNEEFASRILSLGEPRFFGWAVTALFYAAVHYGRAYLRAKSPTVITTHPHFHSEFLRTSGDSRLYGLYRRLKDESERARYDCVPYGADDVAALQAKTLEPFRDTLLPLI